MCILCEKTNHQASDCGLGTESYTNFIGETEVKQTPEQKLEEQCEMLYRLREEEDAEHFVEKAPKHSNFMLDKEDLSKDLDKEQADLFGTILTQTLLEERNLGALK